MTYEFTVTTVSGAVVAGFTSFAHATTFARNEAMTTKSQRKVRRADGSDAAVYVSSGERKGA